MDNSIEQSLPNEEGRYKLCINTNIWLLFLLRITLICLSEICRFKKISVTTDVTIDAFYWSILK